MAKNPRLIDLTGQAFGLWRVTRQAGNTGRGAALWECVCKCGTVRSVIGGDLRRGVSLSCGCDGSRSKIGERARTHGETGTRLYSTWKNMLSRCADKSSLNYGGRGITVCEQWRRFEYFRAWADQSGYTDTMTIERVNVDGNYEPSNCIWIPRKLQAKNKTTSLKSPDGRLWADIASENGISKTAFRCRISAAGWSPEKAATEPMRRRSVQQKGELGRFVPSSEKLWRR